MPATPHFTHASFDDYRIVRDNQAGGHRTTRNRFIPYCLFTDPELVHVGMNETEAKAQGVRYRLAKLPLALVLRTATLTEPRGFMKALIGGDDRILGFTAFGVEACELLATVQTAMLGGLPCTVLRDAIFTHPTIAEGLGGVFFQYCRALIRTTRIANHYVHRSTPANREQLSAWSQL